MLPKTVYEILPLLYITVGIVTISSLSSITGIISGLLLTCTGIVIFIMRLQNRRSYCKLAKPRPSHLAT